MKYNISVFSFIVALFLLSSFLFASISCKKKTTFFYNTLSKDSIYQDTIKPVLFKEKVHASYYSDKLNGRKTASGQVFTNNKYTAAHKTLKFGTKLKVTNVKNSKSVIVTVNDRGPFTKGREIDLSKIAFLEISHNNGTTPLIVNLEIVEE